MSKECTHDSGYTTFFNGQYCNICGEPCSYGRYEVGSVTPGDAPFLRHSNLILSKSDLKEYVPQGGYREYTGDKRWTNGFNRVYIIQYDGEQYGSDDLALSEDKNYYLFRLIESYGKYDCKYWHNDIRIMGR